MEEPMLKYNSIATAFAAVLVGAAAVSAQLDTPKVDDSYTMIKRDLMKNPNAPAVEDTEKMTIVEVIGADPSFSTLNAALKAADMSRKLQGAKAVTLFAPNDQAFAKMSPNALTDLLRPEAKAKLRNILAYHVIPGKIEEMHTGKVKALNGKNLDIKVDDVGNITVNHAKVLKTIETSNGTIYIVDTVIMP